MSYQYNNSTTYQNYTEASLQLSTNTGNRYNQAIGDDTAQQNSSVLSLGAVGDILTGTVLEGGDTPIVEMNGTPIQVRSTALQDTRPGERIYLQITKSNSSEITMKLIDQKTISTASRNGAMQTEIMKNTAKFIEHWKQAQQENPSEYGQMQEEADYVLQNLSSEEKAKLRQMGIEISSSNLTIVKNLLSQIRGEEQDKDLQRAINSVRKQIILENPPDAPEQTQLTVQGNTWNVSDITREANEFLPISEEQTVYLIQNELPLTIENLYKSEYSAKSMPAFTPLSETAFRQMQPQIERTIQTAGMEVNPSTLDAARFLLDHQLPVNTDSLATYTAIRDINKNGFQDTQVAKQLTDSTAETLAQNEGASALSFEYYRHVELSFPSATETADRIAEDINHITEEGFWAFAETGFPYTLENLSMFCQKTTYDVVGERSITALSAHRQLEEIRLKMTWEASYTLAVEDIHIRARELSQVVEALRNQERDYYRQQFRSEGVEPTAEQLKMVQDTNNRMQDLPYLPASALSTTLFTGSLTIERLHENGTTALSSMNTTISYTKVTAYETLMTRPRSDMGDSIRKAFQNVDALLEEMNLPATEDNQRAIRILGYNQMEITPENLEQVKAADGQVQSLIQNLQPSIVLNLVRDGINPLNMPIDELNALIQNYINEEGITDEGKYSEFLQKLERRNTITQEERSSYIGIYRLLDKVTKSKGKDIGTLVRNGQAVTLQNLLTAHRSNRAVGIDTTLDETFGGITGNGLENSISQQMAEGFGKESEHTDSNARNAAIQYNQHLAEQLLNQITPEIIDKMVKDSANGSTLEEFFDTIQEQLTDDTDYTIEGTFESPQESAEVQIQELQLQSLNSFDEATYHFMKTMDIFPSLTNMIMASEVLKGNGRTFRDMDDITNRSVPSPENNMDSESITEELEHLTNHLNSPEEMEQAYAHLETSVTEFVHQEANVGTITGKDIQALKQIRAGLRIMQKMSRKEQFQIPFSINGEWNIINLSVIQNAETKGLLQAEIPTREHGTISTSLLWKETHWEGSVAADSPAGTVLLERNAEQISNAIEQMTAVDHTTENNVPPTTGEMYHMAKQLVALIQHLAI